MNADTYIKGQLAAYCIREGSRAGGVDTMRAIAFVVRNRVDAGWQGGDWMRVLESSDLWSATVPVALESVDLRDGSIKLFLQEIDDIYEGAATDELTFGGLFFAELHNITRDWFLKMVVRDPKSHPRVATVGLTALFG